MACGDRLACLKKYKKFRVKDDKREEKICFLAMEERDDLLEAARIKSAKNTTVCQVAMRKHFTV